jgi:hypothetical protein
VSLNIDEKIVQPMIKKDQMKAPQDNFQDVFNKPPPSTSSNPFDKIEESKNPNMLLSQPQNSKMQSQANRDFDFSDIGNPNSNSKFTKASDFRFEKKPVKLKSKNEDGKI